MPIRINLLAEAQALEELRRRDPVKRTAYVGAGLVAVMLAWSSSLQLKAIIANGELNRLETEIAAKNSEYQQALQNQQKLAEATHRLESLQSLASNRLLYGTLLNALQQTTVNDVQLTRFRADQSYFLTEAVKPKGEKPGKPASVTERITLTLDARDSAVNPGDEVNKYKQAVMDNNYFKSILGTTNEVRLTSLSPPQTAPGSKPFVAFTLECKYPEQKRE